MDTRGHRLLPHTADAVIEAWGPDRPACLVEAMEALVDIFAEAGDAAVTRTLPLSAEAAASADVLVSLLEEVIYVTEVLGVVPVRFHLADTEDGGVAGDMEVVEAGQVELVGPVPKAVSYHGLDIAEHDGTWRCRVLVDV
ncbi:MAG TPA: archease [Acidimicrobiales bacterium]|nr:archease [Acidimicrobiales bacterium]